MINTDIAIAPEKKADKRKVAGKRRKAPRKAVPELLPQNDPADTARHLQKRNPAHHEPHQSDSEITKPPSILESVSRKILSLRKKRVREAVITTGVLLSLSIVLWFLLYHFHATSRHYFEPLIVVPVLTTALCVFSTSRLIQLKLSASKAE